MAIGPALTALMTGLPRELSLREAGHEVRLIAEELAQGSPVGYKVKGFAGQGGRTGTPWIGVFDPEISDRPSVGLYAAYICHPDSKAVTLTLQQGSDDLRDRVGAPAARELLRRRADWVRSALQLAPDPLVPGSFGPGKRQPLYEAGSIGSVTYPLGGLPVEGDLREHLQSMLQVLEDAAAALRRAQGASWTSVDNSSVDGLVRARPAPTFTPKSSESYRVDLPAASQVKTRLHEKVVNDLAREQSDYGWTATSEHPIDLVLRRVIGGEQKVHIVEVKQVRGRDTVGAVREAIGQLYTYRWQRFPEEQRSSVGLVAAFSEDIGPEMQQLLSDELGIAVLWVDEQQWRGCRRASHEHLVPGARPHDL
jgi:hypothetical protein